MSDLDRWMSINKLKLYKDKTELLYTSTLRTVLQRLYHHFVLEMIQFIHPNLPETSVPFLTALCLFPHVNSVCKSAYHLRNISRIRKFLSSKTIPRFSSMLLYPPSLTTAILFCIMCRICFEKALSNQSTKYCHQPDYMLPQIRTHHSSSVRSTLASCKLAS